MKGRVLPSSNSASAPATCCGASDSSRAMIVTTFCDIDPATGANGGRESRLWRIEVSGFPPQKREREPRTLSHRTHRGQIAAHESREVAADREPEPDAFVLARESGLDLHERLEYGRE